MTTSRAPSRNDETLASDPPTADSRLIRNAWALAVSQAAAAGVGLLYWVVAARLYPTESVGTLGALIVTMTTVSTIGQLNYTALLPRLLPRAGEPQRLVRRIYTTTGFSSAALACIVAGVLILAVPEFAELLRSPTMLATYVVGCVAWSWFTLQDAGLAGLGRAPLVAIENSVFGVTKLLALVLFSVGMNGVFHAWVWSTVVAVVVVSSYLMRLTARATPSSTEPVASTDELGPLRFRSVDFASMAAFVAVMATLPVLAVHTVGAEAAAWFAVASSIGFSLEGMVVGVAVSFLVSSSANEAALEANLRRSVRTFLPLILLGAAVVVVAAPVITWFFGPAYAGAATPLRILVLAVPFRFVATLMLGVFRVRFQSVPVLTTQGVPFLVAPAVLLVWSVAGDLSVAALAAAWLAGQAASAAVGLSWYLRTR